MQTQRAVPEQKACPRDETCYFTHLANRFNAGKSGRSTRLVPKQIRSVLNRTYKAAIGRGKVNDWWNEPCTGTGWQCGGRYCQATKQFYVTQRCLDKDWYKSRPLTYTNRVILYCGGMAILGAIGGRLDSGRIGWWGAGLGGGTCLYKALSDKKTVGVPPSRPRQAIGRPQAAVPIAEQMLTTNQIDDIDPAVDDGPRGQVSA